MKEKLIGWMNSRNYNSHLMRLLVGGYVVYLAISIFRELESSGALLALQIFLGAVLLAAGAVIVLVSLYAVFFGYSQEYKGKISSEPEESDVSEEENP